MIVLKLTGWNRHYRVLGSLQLVAQEANRNLRPSLVWSVEYARSTRFCHLCVFLQYLRSQIKTGRVNETKLCTFGSCILVRKPLPLGNDAEIPGGERVRLPSQSEIHGAASDIVILVRTFGP